MCFRRNNLINVLISSIGIVAGLAACVCFAFYGNIHASVWAGLSAIPAGLSLALHCLHRKQSNFCSSKHLRVIIAFSALVGTLAFIGLLDYCILAKAYKIPLLPVKTSYFIVAVWCFMLMKWAILLGYTAYKYIELVDESSQPLLQNQD